MKLEHFGMAEPGDCRLVFTADAEELERAITAEQAAPDAPQAEEDLLTAAVNRTILEGFSALYEQIAAEYGVTPVTDPDFELLAVNRAEGFRAGAQFYALPPLTLGRYTGFVQAVEPHLIRQLTIEMEINRHHGDEERAADAASRMTDTGWQRLSSGFMLFTSTPTHCWPRKAVSSGLPRPRLWPGTSKGTTRICRNRSSAS